MIVALLTSEARNLSVELRVEVLGLARSKVELAVHMLHTMDAYRHT